MGPVRKPHCWFSHEVAHIVSGVSSSQVCQMILAKYMSKTALKDKLYYYEIAFNLLFTCDFKPNLINKTCILNTTKTHHLWEYI